MSRRGASPEKQTALARGAAYGFVARGFHYPDGALLAAFADAGCWSSWPEVLASIDSGLGDLLRAARHTVQTEVAKHAADSTAELLGWQTCYNELFGHAVRGKCPLYELEYGRSEIIQQASELADLAGFYAAFGVQIAEGAEGRPDHLTAECEFMAILCMKEAHGIDSREADHVEVAVDAQRSFLRDHLGRWLPAFAHRVSNGDPVGFYGTLAAFAAALVTAECARFDIPIGPRRIELRPVDPILDTTISCGEGDASTGIRSEQLVQINVESAADGKRSV